MVALGKDQTNEMLGQEQENTPDTQEEIQPKENQHETMPQDTKINPTSYDSNMSQRRRLLPFNKNILVAVLAIIILGGLLGGGLFFYNSQIRKASQPVTAPPPVTVEIIPSPTPEVNLADYSVNILNGSGIAGEAGVVKALLEEKGFAKFETGNAKSYEFKDTEVSLKASVPQKVFEEIEVVLTSYTVVKAGNLEDDAKHDIVITIGEKKTE